MFEDDPDDLDATDLVLLRIDARTLSRKELARSHVINLQELHNSNWYAIRSTSTFFLIGYPKTLNFLEYETLQAKTTQIMLAGSYKRPSVSEGCHELDVHNPKCLKSFDGLSGGPVFCVRAEIGISNPPKFCGMILRGGAEANRIHFLGTSTILMAIENARDA